MAVTPIGALMHQAQTRAESAAFVFHEEVWTYRRLADEAERVARGLVARGVKAGERVALHMMNRPEMLVGTMRVSDSEPSQHRYEPRSNLPS